MARPTKRRGAILVVDDDAAVRALIGTHLRRQGFEVREATDGELALGMIEEEAFALVILDMNMPGMSGADVVRRLREHLETEALPVLILTGKSDKYPLVESLAIGADGYLTKPIRLDELTALVRARLRIDRASAQKALRENEGFYRTLVEGSADGILVSDASGRYVEANAAIYRMLGYSRDEILARYSPNLSATDDPLTPADMDERLAETQAGTGLLVERRYRRKDGTSLPAEVSYTVLPDGRLQRTIRDITVRLAADAEQARLTASLRESERTLRESERNLAEAQRIAHVGSWERDLGTGAVRWSEETRLILGLEPGRTQGTIDDFLAFVHPDDRDRAAASQSDLHASWTPTEREYRIIRPDRSTRHLRERAEVIRDAAGTPLRYVGSTQDVTDEVAAEAERASLVTALRTSEAQLRTALDTMVDGVAIHRAIRDDQGRIIDFVIDYANTAVVATRAIAGSLRVGRTLLELFPADRTNGLFDAYVSVVETGAPFETDDFPYVEPDAASGVSEQVLDLRAARLGDGLIIVVRDVTSRHRAEFEMRRLAHAIEQSADAVMITDGDARIEYVNSAFEQVSGYTRNEVLGQNPRIVKSGIQGPAFYAAMWAALSGGQSFVAELTNRRKDGSLYQEEAVISPIRDNGGKITSYVAVSRDVTRERAREAEQERRARERAIIGGTLAAIRPGATAEATAELICRQVASMTEVASAAIHYFAIDRRATPLAMVRADGGPVPMLSLPARRSETLRQRAAEGPWVEAWADRPGTRNQRMMHGLGLSAIARVPINHDGQLIGILAATSAASDAIAGLTEHLPALLEFAGIAGALVGARVIDLTEGGRLRARVERIIASCAFSPVFQPIVDITSGEHVGYEALTRFSEGIRPDLVFADASAAGVGLELEAATLAASVEASAGLPGGAWLSLNVSPHLVVAGDLLARLLGGAHRPVVLEVTEHTPVGSYPELRAALTRLGLGVRVAVDDAGTGVANFSHIVELRPAFVKLDISLVRGVDSDLTCQALIVGLQHFARESSSEVIAEGVETAEELAALRTLGVRLVQGYLLGRPEPVILAAAPTVVV